MHSRTFLSQSSPPSGSCNDCLFLYSTFICCILTISLALCWIADSSRKHEVITNGLRRGVSPQHRHNPKYRSLRLSLIFWCRLTRNHQTSFIKGSFIPGLSPYSPYVTRVIGCSVGRFSFEPIETRAYTYYRVTTYYQTKQMSTDYQGAKNVLLRSIPFTAWIRSGARWQSFDLNGNINDTQTESLSDTMYDS
jgi:tRNA-specific adenosine deaminase 1